MCFLKCMPARPILVEMINRATTSISYCAEAVPVEHARYRGFDSGKRIEFNGPIRGPAGPLLRNPTGVVEECALDD